MCPLGFRLCKNCEITGIELEELWRERRRSLEDHNWDFSIVDTSFVEKTEKKPEEP